MGVFGRKLEGSHSLFYCFLTNVRENDINDAQVILFSSI